MKMIVRNLLEIAMNTEDYEQQESLQELVKDLVDELEDTINCPSNWRSIKEELLEEYKENNDALYILGW